MIIAKVSLGSSFNIFPNWSSITGGGRYVKGAGKVWGRAAKGAREGSGKGCE